MNPDAESVAAKSNPPVERVMLVFSNATDELVTEYALPDFDLEAFRKWFNADGDDPLMYLCYMLVPKDVEFISGYLAEPVAFDFSQYNYSVEAYVSDENWKKFYAKT